MGYENQTVAFNRNRKRTSFSDQDCKTLALTNIPVENRIFIEREGERIDLGSGLAPENRKWLYSYLKDALENSTASIAPEGMELIREVIDEENRPKPLIQLVDRYSEHEVDPLDFDDPMAQETDWKSMATASASYRTHELVEKPQLRMEFTAPVGALAPLLIPCGMGSAGLYFSFQEFANNDYQLSFGVALLGLLSLVFTAAFGYLIY